MADGLGGVTERGVLTATDEAWTLARSRAAVIAELAGLDVVGHEAVDEAAAAYCPLSHPCLLPEPIQGRRK